MIAIIMLTVTLYLSCLELMDALAEKQALHRMCNLFKSKDF